MKPGVEPGMLMCEPAAPLPPSPPTVCASAESKSWGLVQSQGPTNPYPARDGEKGQVGDQGRIGQDGAPGIVGLRGDIGDTPTLEGLKVDWTAPSHKRIGF
jgi:hypothetical protein